MDGRTPGTALIVVTPWLDHGIHSITASAGCDAPEWIAGSSPAMTTTEAEPGHDDDGAGPRAQR